MGLEYLFPYIKNPLVKEAFEKIDRLHFVLPEYEYDAYANHPLPIGYGQTISQPQTVAFMLELLEPRKGNKILDIGAGSGWQTALLAYIVGEKGKVYAIERIPQLKRFGERNVKKYNFIEKGIVKFFCKDGKKGLKEYAPYDRIIVAASANKIPKDLLSQLKEGGILVIPVKTSIMKVIKEKNNYKIEEYKGFAFVPLV